jgi:hypothetical protein
VPSGFLAWIEEPLAEAREELEKVQLRVDEHRQWLAVFRALNKAQSRCRELRKLASWMNGEPQISTRKKPIARRVRRD